MSPNATTDQTAAANRLVPRKYTPDTAGVSLIPAVTPTPNPATHGRVLAIVASSTAASSRLIWP